MARTHARVLVNIWADGDFTKLSGSEQRLYLLLLSQPDLNLCGVLPLRPKRWATFCPEDTPESLLEELEGLQRAHYVLVDDSVDEVWIRSFIRYDGLLKSPNMVKAMWKVFDQLLSEPIREGFRELFQQLVSEGMTKPHGEGEGVGGGSGSKILERCATCRKLPMDCECPK